MRKTSFKRIISDQDLLPLKMGVIFYVLDWLYHSFNGYYFDFFSNFAYVFVGLIVYTFVRVISNVLSYNPKKIDPYFLNSTINAEIMGEVNNYYIFEDKIGVYKSEVNLDRTSNKDIFIYTLIDNPLKIYYQFEAYEKILYASGTYSSELVINQIKRYKHQLKLMIKQNEIQSS
ncbi:hypothetical protein G3M74_13300 [Paenibacillus polymyxa]|nr:hypothetical protein [Paenibacillus polymyxa]